MSKIRMSESCIQIIKWGFLGWGGMHIMRTGSIICPEAGWRLQEGFQLKEEGGKALDKTWKTGCFGGEQVLGWNGGWKHTRENLGSKSNTCSVIPLLHRIKHTLYYVQPEFVKDAWSRSSGTGGMELEAGIQQWQVIILLCKGKNVLRWKESQGMYVSVRVQVARTESKRRAKLCYELEPGKMEKRRNTANILQIA